MNRETTVMGFFPALEAGYEPKNYSFYKQEVPIGNYLAKLDFMLWSKTFMAINCFFTIKDGGKKISLSVYKKAGVDDLYLAGDTEIRFVSFGTMLLLSVESNQNGKPVLKDAIVQGNMASD